MANELFFIPIFLKALRAADPERSLAEAFASIVQKSGQPDFEQGYAQFRDWLDVAARDEGLDTEDWMALLTPDEMGFVLLRDGAIVDRAVLSLGERRSVMDRIVPGHYSLALETGLQLWEGELTAQDLLWTEARPDEPLAWAASSEEEREPPTRTDNLPDVGMILNVYAGLEYGRLELLINKCEEQS